MNCKSCGAVITGEERFCPKCGKELQETEFEPTFSNESINDRREPTKSSAFICGIISLFFAGFILGVIAVVLSKDPEQRNAKAAQILGIIGIIGWALYIILVLL